MGVFLTILTRLTFRVGGYFDYFLSTSISLIIPETADISPRSWTQTSATLTLHSQNRLAPKLFRETPDVLFVDSVILGHTLLSLVRQLLCLTANYNAIFSLLCAQVPLPASHDSVDVPTCIWPSDSFFVVPPYLSPDASTGFSFLRSLDLYSAVAVIYNCGVFVPRDRG